MARCRLRRILGGEAWGGGGENEDVGIIWLNLVNIGNAWEVLDKRCWWAYIDISSSGERHCDVVGSKTADYRLFSIAQHHLTPCVFFHRLKGACEPPAQIHGRHAKNLARRAWPNIIGVGGCFNFLLLHSLGE